MLFPSLPSGPDEAPLPLADMYATFSGIEPDRKTRLTKVIEILGGKCSKDLTMGCTHLFSNTRFSPKAKAVRTRKVLLLSPTYIDELSILFRQYHRESGTSTINIRLPDTTTHKVLPLAGARITATGLSKDQRIELKNKIEQLGGKYTGELTSNCTHLLALERQGVKYNYAIQHNILVLNPDWLTHSSKDILIGSEWCRDETRYLLDPKQSQSSPSRSMSGPITDLIRIEESQYTFGPANPCPSFSISDLGASLDDCSMNRYLPRLKRTESSPQWGLDDEANQAVEKRGMKRHMSMDSGKKNNLGQHSARDMIEINRMKRGKSQRTQTKPQRHTLTAMELCATEEEIALDKQLSKTAHGATPFLRDCQVHLSGFGATPERETRMRRILLHGEATRVSRLGNLVTHMVVGGFHQPDFCTIHAMAIGPVIVPAKWLVDSFKAGKMLPTHLYRLEIIPSDDGKGTFQLAYHSMPLISTHLNPEPPGCNTQYSCDDQENGPLMSRSRNLTLTSNEMKSLSLSTISICTTINETERSTNLFRQPTRHTQEFRRRDLLNAPGQAFKHTRGVLSEKCVFTDN